MSFLKKGGTGNPFATGGQSGGGQPPRGYQGNNNNAGGGRGGGGRFQQQQGNSGRGQGNTFAGGRGVGGAQSTNPFAAGRGGGNNNQQVNFGHAQHQQNPQQNTYGGNQAASKGNFNPFASGGSGGGGGGTMDMDGGGQMSGGFGKPNPPRPIIAHNNAGARVGSANPFAASSHQGVGNVFATNSGNVNSFANGGQSVGAFPAQKQNPFQGQSPSQGFPASGGFAQNHQPQQQHSTGFGARAPPPVGNPFFGGGQHQQHQQHQHQQQSAPAAPVRAEVNQQAINAVNMSAALAPSQVEELDLGLGAGLLDTGISSSIAAHSHLPVPPPINTGAQSGTGSDSTAAQQVKTLLDSILSSCPASALSEEPPQQGDVFKLGTSLVAGRIPAVPPARAAPSTAHLGQSGAQANPFVGATRPAFGALQ